MNLLGGISECLNPKSIFRHFISPPTAKNLKITGKHVLITGGNKGIGLGAVLEMAKHSPESITICARSKESLKDACKKVNEINLKIKVDYFILDLADWDSIDKTVFEILESHNKFDVVIGNAGVCLDGKLANGVEKNMGINHFGHFKFVVSLLNGLDEPVGRIVMTASLAARFLGDHGIVDFDDLGIEKEDHVFGGSIRVFYLYGQSKLANILFVKMLAEKMPGTLCHSLHPGNVRSEIQKVNMSRLMWPIIDFIFSIILRSQRYGCQTILHAAFSTDQSATSENGQFFDNCEPGILQAGNNKEMRDKLWEVSVKTTGVDLKIKQ